MRAALKPNFAMRAAIFGACSLGGNTPLKFKFTPQKRMRLPLPSTKCSPEVLTNPFAPAGEAFIHETSVTVLDSSNGGSAKGNIAAALLAPGVLWACALET